VRFDGDLPFLGEIVWLSLEQGGRTSGPPRTPEDQDYAATAFVPPRTVSDGLASFVVRAADRSAWRSEAAASWLTVGSEGAQSVEPGSVVVVTEGSRPVAYFHVHTVLRRQP
jgi:hypothetical protein